MENNRKIEFKDITQFIGDFINFCLKFKYLFVLTILFGGVLGFCYAYFNKTKYEAKLSFIINESKASTQNPLAALASQLNIGSSSLNLSEDKILFLITTKRILGQSLLTDLNNTKLTVADRLIELLDLKNKYKKDPDIINFKSFTSRKIEKLNYVENKIIDILINYILKSKDFSFEPVKKKTTSFVTQTSSGIILLAFKSEDEMLSKVFVESIYNNLSEFYINIITQNLQASYNLVSKREDSLKRVMSGFEVQTADAFDNAIGVYKFKGKIQQNRLKRENEILNTMYAEVVKNREIAKFNLEQEKPVLQIIDTPTFPLEQHFKSTLIFSIVGVISFTFIFIAGMFFLFLKKTNKLQIG